MAAKPYAIDEMISAKAIAARDDSGGLIESVTDEEILAAHRLVLDGSLLAAASSVVSERGGEFI